MRQSDIYNSEIAPNLKDGATISFGHGFNIHYGKIIPAKNINVMTVKPGWIGTKMIKNHKIPKFMITNVDNIGKKIFTGFLKNKSILYVPSYWRIIMFIYKLVPEFIFKILIK